MQHNTSLWWKQQRLPECWTSTFSWKNTATMLNIYIFNMLTTFARVCHKIHVGLQGKHVQHKTCVSNMFQWKPLGNTFTICSIPRYATVFPKAVHWKKNTFDFFVAHFWHWMPNNVIVLQRACKCCHKVEFLYVHETHNKHVENLHVQYSCNSCTFCCHKITCWPSRLNMCKHTCFSKVLFASEQLWETLLQSWPRPGFWQHLVDILAFKARNCKSVSQSVSMQQLWKQFVFDACVCLEGQHVILWQKHQYQNVENTYFHETRNKHVEHIHFQHAGNICTLFVIKQTNTCWPSRPNMCKKQKCVYVFQSVSR